MDWWPNLSEGEGDGGFLACIIPGLRVLWLTGMGDSKALLGEMTELMMLPPDIDEVIDDVIRVAEEVGDDVTAQLDEEEEAALLTDRSTAETLRLGLYLGASLKGTEKQGGEVGIGMYPSSSSGSS